MRLRFLPVIALFLSSPALAGAAWSCESRALVGPDVYGGIGVTKVAAEESAHAACREDHLICSETCAELGDPTHFTDAHGITHGLGYVAPRTRNGSLYWQPAVRSSAPASYDLRALGWVSPIKDQGQCGSCWAFSATGTLTSALLRAGRGSFDLSEQDMVSCDAAAYGCSGGEMSDLTYLVDHGLPLESAYPYTASDSRCGSPEPPVAAKGARWGYVGSQEAGPTDAEVKQAELDYGVLSVVVAAGGDDWANGGHMTDCSYSGQNHMVGLAGWLASGEQIVKNSWGVPWGDAGYAYAPLGCNELGSGSESVGFVVVDGGPAPTPPHVTLPEEISIKTGTSVSIGVPAESGVTYEWAANGDALPDTTSEIYVDPTVDTTYQITATTAAGTAESSVLVKVLATR